MLEQANIDAANIASAGINLARELVIRFDDRPQHLARQKELMRGLTHREVQRALVDWNNALCTQEKNLSDEQKAIRHKLTQMIPAFCELREIRSDAPEMVKEILKENGQVFPIGEFDSLDTRLPPPDMQSPNKRCYGLFLPWEETPLVSVYTTLFKRKLDENGQVPFTDLPETVRPLPNSPIHEIEDPNTVVAYEIVNPALINKEVRSLRGIPCGPELLLKATRDLQAKIPTLGMVTTLSPIDTKAPRNEDQPTNFFLDWMRREFAYGNEVRLTQKERQTVLDMAKEVSNPIHNPHDDAGQVLMRLLQLPPAHLMRHKNHPFNILLEDLHTEYLLTVKDPKRPLHATDSVSDFHWTNGAIFGNINVWGNTQAVDNAYATTNNHPYMLDEATVEIAKRAYTERGTISLSPHMFNRFMSRMKERAAEQGLDDPRSEDFNIRLQYNLNPSIKIFSLSKNRADSGGLTAGF